MTSFLETKMFFTLLYLLPGLPKNKYSLLHVYFTLLYLIDDILDFLKTTLYINQTLQYVTCSLSLFLVAQLQIDTRMNDFFKAYTNICISNQCFTFSQKGYRLLLIKCLQSNIFQSNIKWS